MTAATGGAGGQASSSDPQAQGQAPNTPPASAPQAGTDPNTGTGTTAGDGLTDADLRKIVADLRKEQASNRVKLKQFEDAQAAADLAKLSDIDKLTKQYQQAQEQLAALQIEQQQYRLAKEIAKHAPSLNLIDPDAAQLMLSAGGEIEHDADGKPTNVAKLLEKLVAEKPYLVASNVTRPPAPPSSGGATNPGRSAGGAPPAGQARTDPKEAYKTHRERGGLANPNIWKRS